MNENFCLCSRSLFSSFQHFTFQECWNFFRLWRNNPPKTDLVEKKTLFFILFFLVFCGIQKSIWCFLRKAINFVLKTFFFSSTFPAEHLTQEAFMLKFPRNICNTRKEEKFFLYFFFWVMRLDIPHKLFECG